MTTLSIPHVVQPGDSGDREVRGDRPLPLAAGRLWIVRSGRIDVFATPMKDGAQIGVRSHLFRVESAGAVFGSEERNGLALLGVGAPGTSVREVELAGLTADAIRPLVESWCRAAHDALTTHVRMPTHQIVEPADILELAAGATIRCALPLAWLELVSGEALLMGAPAGALRIGVAVPVSDKTWVTLPTAATLRIRGWDDRWNAREGGTVVSQVEQLNRLLLTLVADRQHTVELAQRERAQRRARAREKTMSSVLSTLADTIAGTGGHKRLAVPSSSEGQSEADALFPAFRLVAAASGIELHEATAKHEEIAPKDPVSALARSWRVRTRRVALHAGWWNHDGVPLLAVLADRPRPVALLPRVGAYVLVDPHAGTETRLDATVAATLGPFAYVLYRPFTSDALRAIDLLRFGLRGTRRDLAMVGAMGILVALLGLVPPMAIAALYNTIIPGAQHGQLIQMVLGLIVCGLAVTAFEAVRGFAILRLEFHTGPGVQAAVWDRLLKLPLPFFKSYTAGDLAMRVMSIEEMRNIASGTVVTVVLTGVLSLTNVGLLFAYNMSLAWIGVGLIGTAFAVSWILSYLQVRRQRLILPLRSRIAGVVHQLLAGMAKLKAAGAEVHGFSMWSRLFSEQRRLQFGARSLRNMQTVFATTFPLLASVVLFSAAIGSEPARAPELTLGAAPAAAPIMPTGDFLAFIAAFNIALGGMLSSCTALVSALAIVPLYEQLTPILKTTPEVHTGSRDPGELSGAVELQHVTFRYSADAPLALRDVSLRVRAGEFVALVGPSGCGKSTILRLLLGFEVPETGSVSYDEQDLRGLDPEIVRRQIGVVTQTGRLMAGDIYTNIVGAAAVRLEDAWEAARMAGLDEDIRQMPMGMHTVISDGGGTFSGGQRQRLMIARALLHRPRILLFDEATSALDNRTQDIVSRNLERLKFTRIVVAHRLSTIRHADRSYVMRAGTIVEIGGFEELLARNGPFSDLARSQLL